MQGGNKKPHVLWWEPSVVSVCPGISPPGNFISRHWVYTKTARWKPFLARVHLLPAASVPSYHESHQPGSWEAPGWSGQHHLSKWAYNTLRCVKFISSVPNSFLLMSSMWVHCGVFYCYWDRRITFYWSLLKRKQSFSSGRTKALPS